MKNILLKPILLSALFVSTLFLSFKSSAGGIGNGGFIFECVENGKAVYKLYDYEEFRNYAHGFTPDLGGPGLTTMQRVNFVLDRLALVNPSRAARFRELAKNFLTDQEDLNESVEEFIPVQDLGAAIKPRNCELLQIAQQRGPDQKPHPDQKTYIVDNDLYNKVEKAGFTEVTAGLILHEIAYNEYLQEPTRTGSPTLVRYFNAFISSSRMNGISEKDYFNALVGDGKKPSAVRNLDYHGQEVSVAASPNTSLIPSIHIEIVSPSESSTPLHVDTKYGVLNCNDINIQPATGRLISCDGPDNFITTELGPEPVNAFNIELYDSGAIRSLMMAGAPYTMNLFGTKLQVTGVIFNKDGFPSLLTVNQTEMLVAGQRYLVTSLQLNPVTHKIIWVEVTSYLTFNYQNVEYIPSKFVPISNEDTMFSEYLVAAHDRVGRNSCFYINNPSNEERKCTPEEESLVRKSTWNPQR